MENSLAQQMEHAERLEDMEELAVEPIGPEIYRDGEIQIIQDGGVRLAVSLESMEYLGSRTNGIVELTDHLSDEWAPVVEDLLINPGEFEPMDYVTEWVAEILGY